MCISHIHTLVYVAFPSCLRLENQFVVFSSIFLITRSTRTCRCHGKWSSVFGSSVFFGREESIWSEITNPFLDSPKKKCSLTELTPAPNADEFNKRGVCFIEWNVFVTFITEQSSHEKSCSRKRLFQANAKSYNSRKQFIEGKKWHCSTVAWAGRGRGAWAPWAPPIILTSTFNLVSCHALHDHSALRFNVFISVR